MPGRRHNDRCLMWKSRVVVIDNGLADLASRSGLGQCDDGPAESAAGDACPIDAGHGTHRFDKRIDRRR